MKIVKIQILLVIVLLGNAKCIQGMMQQAKQVRRFRPQPVITQPTQFQASPPIVVNKPIQQSTIATWKDWFKSFFYTQPSKPITYVTEEDYVSPFGYGGQKRMYTTSKEQQKSSWRNYVEEPSTMSYIPFTQEHKKESALAQYKQLLDDIEKVIEKEIYLHKHFKELSKEDKFKIYGEEIEVKEKIKDFDFNTIIDYQEELLTYYAAILKSYVSMCKRNEVIVYIRLSLVALTGKILEIFKEFNIGSLEIDKIKEKHLSLFKDIEEVFEKNKKFYYELQQGQEERRVKHQQEYYEKEGREWQQKKKRQEQEEIERQKKEEQRKQREQQEQAERQKRKEEQEQRWEQEFRTHWEQEFRAHNEGTQSKLAVAKNKLTQLLGISAASSEKEIGNAYRKFVKQYHPDVTKKPNDPMSLKLKNEINPAWDEYNDVLKAINQEKMNRE